MFKKIKMMKHNLYALNPVICVLYFEEEERVDIMNRKQNMVETSKNVFYSFKLQLV